MGSWCCGEYGDQLFVEIEEDEALNVSLLSELIFSNAPGKGSQYFFFIISWQAHLLFLALVSPCKTRLKEMAECVLFCHEKQHSPVLTIFV